MTYRGSHAAGAAANTGPSESGGGGSGGQSLPLSPILAGIETKPSPWNGILFAPTVVLDLPTVLILLWYKFSLTQVPRFGPNWVANTNSHQFVYMYVLPDCNRKENSKLYVPKSLCEGQFLNHGRENLHFLTVHLKTTMTQINDIVL